MSSLAQAEFHPADVWRPAINPWWIAGTVMLSTFMEVLDTSIANVALPHIAGSLSAGVDESTWVLTSYLVSNAIVLPLTGWFSRLFGRKNFYMACVLIFIVSSLLCGTHTAAAGVLPRAAGSGRRRVAAGVASNPGGKFSAREAGHGHGHLWNGRGDSSDHRPNAWRMDHG
jgi:MFS family permease